jgi:hypothetical protein
MLAQITISGLADLQAVNDNATIDPFAHVLIADPIPSDIVAVDLSFPTVNGTLTDLNAPSDNSAIRVTPNGITSYLVVGTAAQVTADLDALVFTPTGKHTRSVVLAIDQEKRISETSPECDPFG